MMQNIITVIVTYLVWKLFTRWLPLFVAGVRLGLLQSKLRRLKKQADELVSMYHDSMKAYEEAMAVASEVDKPKLEMTQALAAQAVTSGLRLLVAEMEQLKNKANSETQFINELATKKGLL